MHQAGSIIIIIILIIIRLFYTYEGDKHYHWQHPIECTKTILSARPLKEQHFDLNRGEFQDALNLRYNKPLRNLPTKCPCNQPYTITHAMNCHRGGFINNRHDNIRDYEASLLKKVCNDVQVEPPLQPCDGFTFRPCVNTSPEARSDIRAKGFFRDGQNNFVDVQVTNADCASQIDRTIKSILKSKETSKKSEYNIRIMEVEHGTFTPLIFTVKGVMGPECRAYHKLEKSRRRLAKSMRKSHG